MGGDQQRLTDPERANLVAYLDGELNEAESRALATKVTQSVTARREIESLQKTWELLDFLPRPDAAPDFATRTVSLALARGAGDGKWAGIAGRATRLATRGAALLGVSAAALGLGYALARWAWPDTSARLIRDLPIAEHLDEYKSVGSFEFLQRLEELPAFSEDVE